ncbi:response regulator [Thiofilum flexile]|uniref:response regulator n=1 Tax=Thiofilum flexile TaxID=125627 RepID=UPI000368B41F|nr:response regulator [Thiofilum flexile]
MAHILIIDDSQVEARMLKGMLEHAGHTVSHATNGYEGIEIAKVENPDLILMDVVMPLINGFQATRELSRAPETQHIPIVVCSSKDSDTDFLWAKRQGARGYLIKPIRAPELLTLVKRFVLEQG